jgi:hypothetical protein
MDGGIDREEYHWAQEGRLRGERVLYAMSAWSIMGGDATAGFGENVHRRWRCAVDHCLLAGIFYPESFMLSDWRTLVTYSLIPYHAKLYSR